MFWTIAQSINLMKLSKFHLNKFHLKIEKKNSECVISSNCCCRQILKFLNYLIHPDLTLLILIIFIKWYTKFALAVFCYHWSYLSSSLCYQSLIWLSYPFSRFKILLLNFIYQRSLTFTYAKSYHQFYHYTNKKTFLRLLFTELYETYKAY